MTRSRKRRDLTPRENRALQQSAIQEKQSTLQEGLPEERKTLQPHLRPRYALWPTSKPGARATPPPPRMKPINALRPEQVVDFGYDWEHAGHESDVEHDQREITRHQTGQELLKKRKQRL